MEQKRDKNLDSFGNKTNKMELGGNMTDKEKKFREQKFEENFRKERDDDKKFWFWNVTLLLLLELDNICSFYKLL